MALNPAEAKALEEKALAWIDSHPEGLVLNIKDSKGFQFVEGCNTLMKYKSDNGEIIITIGFKEPINGSNSLEDVQRTFSMIALDRLPVPGLEHSSSWDVYPQSPLSSFDEGVLIHGFEGGKIQMKVESRMFAIYGRRKDITVPMDSKAPEGSYFQARRDFKLHLELNLPVPA